MGYVPVKLYANKDTIKQQILCPSPSPPFLFQKAGLGEEFITLINRIRLDSIIGNVFRLQIF